MFPVLLIKKTERADFAIVALATTAESDTTNLQSSIVNFQFVWVFSDPAHLSP
jgi:hypothetical protein